MIGDNLYRVTNTETSAFLLLQGRGEILHDRAPWSRFSGHCWPRQQRRWIYRWESTAQPRLLSPEAHHALLTCFITFFSSGKKGKKSITSWSKADSSCVLYCEECDKPCYLSAVSFSLLWRPTNLMSWFRFVGWKFQQVRYSVTLIPQLVVSFHLHFSFFR